MHWSLSQIFKYEQISANESVCFFELNKYADDDVTVVSTETCVGFIQKTAPTNGELTALGNEIASNKTSGDELSLLII